MLRQACGFDKLLLDSLYEDDLTRRQLQLQNAGYGHGGIAMQHEFDNQRQNDPFAVSQNIAPPTNVQMALLAQQQQQQQMMFQQQNQQQHHNMMLVPHQYPQSQYPQQLQLMASSNSNPFGDPLPLTSYPQSPLPQQGNYHLI